MPLVEWLSSHDEVVRGLYHGTDRRRRRNDAEAALEAVVGHSLSYLPSTIYARIADVFLAGSHISTVELAWS
jgi:hypothetical protein